MIGPMTTDRPGLPPPSRLASWLLTSVLVGWLIAYNAFRIAGESPRGSILVSLVPGIVLGLIFLGVTVLVWRRNVERHGGEIVIPDAEALDQTSRDALRLAAFVVGALAVASLAVGAILVADWLDTPEGQRSLAKVLVGGWDLIAGLWMAAETPRLVRGHAEDLESLALGSVLTAVLGGVAISRGWNDAAQAVAIVVAGVSAGACQLGLWRVTGARGVPVATFVLVAITALSLILPLTL
jgi:hypothetical protein